MKFEEKVNERGFIAKNFENEKSKSRLFCLVTSLFFTFAILSFCFIIISTQIVTLAF